MLCFLIMASYKQLPGQMCLFCKSGPWVQPHHNHIVVCSAIWKSQWQNNVQTLVYCSCVCVCVWQHHYLSMKLLKYETRKLLHVSPTLESITIRMRLNSTTKLPVNTEKRREKTRNIWRVFQALFFSPNTVLVSVIWALILLHFVPHSCDISNMIQKEQNKINCESDGSLWLFKLRRNGFWQGFIN